MKDMAVRPILQLGNPKLRETSAAVQDFHQVQRTLEDLSDTLAEFRRTHGFGRGISAIQIGEAVRVIFLRVEGMAYELINPEFVSKSRELFEMWDDCFSFPDLMVWLRRHNEVTIRYQTRDGAWQTLPAKDAMSELIQHEMDHLDGILAIDHAQGKAALATRAEYLRQQSLKQLAL